MQQSSIFAFATNEPEVMASFQEHKCDEILLTANDAIDVYAEILEVQNKSYELGLNLKLPVYEVDRIRSMNADPRSRLLQVIIESAKQLELTWSSIISALKSSAVNEPLLAAKLEAKHCPIVSLPPPVNDAAVAHSRQPLSPFDVYVASLKDGYMQDPFPVHDKWPKIKAAEFINLSLLIGRRSRYQYSHEYTEAMFHGDNKISIFGCCESITPADIAKNAKGRRRCVLVEGAPGIGKSTLAWMLCHEWGQGNMLQQYQVVLLLRLREKRVREVKTGEDAFKLFKSRATKDLDFSFLSEGGGDGVFLLLDGWDELPVKLREGEDSFFLDLLKGQVLPHATILVTTRPHASEVIACECEDRICQCIEITGFTEENVRAFVQQNASELLDDLTTYLSYYPHIESMMYNPLHAAIVVEVYRQNKAENVPVPKTTTELYDSLVRTLLQRYLKESPEVAKRRLKFKSIKALPQDILEKVNRIAEVAFNGITNKQQVVFDENDLPEDFDHLGLMQCIPEIFYDEGVVSSYSFLHLTIQEYFAAYHISLKTTEQQLEIFQSYHHTTSMKMVLKFFAGQTNFHGIKDQELVPLLGLNTLHEDRNQLRTKSRPRIMSSKYGLHYIFEANERANILDILSNVHMALTLCTPFECYVLGFIMSHASCRWVLRLCNITSKSILNFARGTMHRDHLHSLRARDQAITLEFSNSFNMRKKQMIDLGSLSMAHPLFLKRISKLTLVNCCLGGNPLVSPHIHLESLELEGSHWCDSNIQQEVLCLLHDQNTLKSLTYSDVFHHGLESTKTTESETLFKWLLYSECSLRTLKFYSASAEVNEALLNALCHNCTLRELDMSSSTIKPEVLAHCLPLLSVVKLDLTCCGFGDADIALISKGLCGNMKLKTVRLAHNRFRDSGIIALVESLLRVNTTLETIDLSDSLISSKTLQQLQEMPKLTVSRQFLWRGENCGYVYSGDYKFTENGLADCIQ